MNNSIPTDLHWYKATASTSGNGCVEVTHLPDGGVRIRHSMKPDAEVIEYSGWEWDCFLDGVRKGEFNRPGTGS